MNNKPNLLYITHGSNDFTDDFMFMGLTYYKDLFNIYYAFAGSEHGQPTTIEERANNIFYGWKDTWIFAANQFNYLDESIQYDVCVVGMIWKENQQRFFELQHLLKPGIPIVIFDGLDDCHPIIPCRVPATHYYKNNTVFGNYHNIFMPFSCPYEIAFQDNDLPIKYLINCQLGFTHPFRKETVAVVDKFVKKNNIQDQCLISLFKDGKNIIGNSPRTPIDQYWNILNQSKIIIHERGAGFDAFRFWEGIATGNIVLCTPENLFGISQTPMPPNVAVWESYDHLESLLSQLINVSENDIMNLRKISKDFIRSIHMPHNRWEKIFKNMKTKIY